MNISSMGGGCIRLTFEVVKMQAIRYETINGKRVRRQKNIRKDYQSFQQKC